MRRIVAILLTAMLLLSGCTESGTYVPTGDGLGGVEYTDPGAEPEKEQKLSLVYDPDKGLNPYTCANYANRMLMSLLYQSLFVVDADYNVEPQLCSRYIVSQDMRTYTFYVEQATFVDGTELTAADVKASLDMARTSPVYRGRLGNVTNIYITGDGGVRITLSTAYENFPLLLNIPIVRADQVEEAYPEGTGPYYLMETVTGHRLVLRVDWWCSAKLPIKADWIPLISSTDSRQIRDYFELGDVGVVCANPASDNYVDFRNDYDLWDCESGVFLYLGCRARSSVFSNERVRQALTYAIDRQTIVNTYYRTFGMAATLPASPASPYYNKTLAAQYEYEDGKLAAVLEEEGLSGKSIVLLVNGEDSRRIKVAQAIAEMLEACSLTVTVKALSGSSYTQALDYGSYDLHLGQTMLSPNMDLSAFFDTGGTLDFCGMNNSTISSLCKTALSSTQGYDALHKAVMSDAMLCPVAFLTYAIYVKADLIGDFSPSRDCVFYYSLGKTMDDVLNKK